MSEVSRIFEALYSHFLLRDIVAKVIPGAIAIAVIVVSFFPNAYEQIQDILFEANLLSWILVYGLGFMFGMFLQFTGESIHLISIHVWEPTEIHSREQISTKRDIEFLARAKDYPELLRKRERLAIFKEMAGNYSMAFLLSSISILSGPLLRNEPITQNMLILSLGFLFIVIILVFQNRAQAREQRAWEEFSKSYKDEHEDIPESGDLSQNGADDEDSRKTRNGLSIRPSEDN